MKRLLTILFIFYAGFTLHANDTKSQTSDEGFDITELIMHHIGDSHEFHIISFPKSSGETLDITLPLPVILWDNHGLHLFLSSKFHTGKAEKIVYSRGSYYTLLNEKIYQTDAEGSLSYNAAGDVTNKKPLDISITKNVSSMFLSIAILLLLFIPAAKNYNRKDGISAPQGVQKVLEPIVLFVRDDIVKSQIDKNKADFFMPFLMTLFFFIWTNNLLGLIPFFPGNANLSGNIAFTFTLSVFAFLAINVFGSKHYWKDIFTAPGAPLYIKVLLVPIEIIGIFTKPFALMIRLFANITAGHIIILSLTSIIFVLQTIYASPLTVLLSLVMYSLEFLVGALQAYVFTLLTALFIGIAVNKEQ
ncbi:F0F1 ATP synthase subunit A [Geofilum sp. OHC36d9]|uniref:F0F1 ATP synthase subunit A n=1 Tax=Geofilum sp. OHC36d9 TaxID=3458413 RepID=UPI0040348756